MRQLRVVSPAKVNLSLHVLGKRPDGYHEIRTLMQLVDLSDSILLEKEAEGVQLQLSGLTAGVPRDNTNLILRAAHRFREEMGISGGVSIHLEKRIPPAAGLGGGSSNAAATLWGLNHLFGFPLSRAKLKEMALSLGSDVPFFFGSGCALGEGRGEVLRDVRLGSQPVVIVYPGFGISSAWAYGNLKLTNRGEEGNLKGLGERTCGEEPSPAIGINQLEEAVTEAYPLLQSIKAALLDSGARVALMSGSGSSVFGVFEDKAKAAKAARPFRIQRHWVHEGRTLDFNPIFEEEGRRANTG